MGLESRDRNGQNDGSVTGVRCAETFGPDRLLPDSTRYEVEVNSSTTRSQSGRITTRATHDSGLAVSPAEQRASNGNAAIDSVVIVGSDPLVFEPASASVLVRWPHASLKSVRSATKGLEIVEQDRPDLVVLSDVPDSKLHEFAKNLRMRSNAPLLVMGKVPETRTEAAMEAIACLEAGADGYVLLPCSLSELTVRLWSLVRRAKPIPLREFNSPVASGELMMDPIAHEAYMGGKPLNLTNTEFDLLCLLVNNWNIVVARQILEKNFRTDRNVTYDKVKKYVQRLRGKLQDDSREPRWIANVHVVGYRFVGPAPTAV